MKKTVQRMAGQKQNVNKWIVLGLAVSGTLLAITTVCSVAAIYYINLVENIKDSKVTDAKKMVTASSCITVCSGGLVVIALFGYLFYKQKKMDESAKKKQWILSNRTGDLEGERAREHTIRSVRTTNTSESQL